MFKHLLKTIFVFSLILLNACQEDSEDLTVADLPSNPIEPIKSQNISAERLHAIEHYQAYLQKTAFKTHYAEALRRVADLELEISEEEKIKAHENAEKKREEIMLSSIEHYNTYLITYAGHEKNDLILYQLAKAYSLTGDIEKSMLSMDKIVKDYPNSRHIDEVQFRRGEILFVFQDYNQAEIAYNAIIINSPNSTFYEKSLYKLGWSQFKQSKYIQTLNIYMSLLDIKESEHKIDQYGISTNISNSEKDFIIDSLRVVSLSLSYKNGHKTIKEMFKKTPNKLYKPLIYQQLGKLYSKKGRYHDAAKTYMAFTKENPSSPLAPEFHMHALQSYIDGGINNKILASKILYVKNYDVGTLFWSRQTASDKNKIRPNLIKHISELSHHFYAKAKKTNKRKDFKLAIKWYKNYLASFPKEKNTAYMNFLLAEALFDSKQFKHALSEYEKSAYQYPSHQKSAESAYAALLTYNILLKKATPVELKNIKRQALISAIRFSNTFPNDKHATAVISKTSENLLQLKRYKQASEFSKRIIDNKKLKRISLLRTAWIVHAHSQFELKNYTIAEKAYLMALNKIPKKGKLNKKLRSQLTDKLAASIYRQAEGYQSKGNNKLAAYHFLRIGKTAPSSPFHATAEYDAATLYIIMKEWKIAAKILEGFRYKFPKQKKYAQGISSKLALTYTQTGQFNKAAKEISTLSRYSKSPEDRRKLIWEAAEMYAKAGQTKAANKLYIKYVNKYKQPFSQSMEAHQRILTYYKNSKQRKKWLKKLIKAEKRGKKSRTDHSRFLAASASFELAQPIINSFNKIKLNIPLKKSLRNKKKKMKAAIKSLRSVMAYKVAKLSTASTYNMGEIYNQLAQSLMNSQRPKKLSADELEQYDILLEEQAYPFEEKAIKIHTSNIKRTQQGIFDEWIKKSMKVLALFQPVRFAKHEKVAPYALITH